MAGQQQTHGESEQKDAGVGGGKGCRGGSRITWTGSGPESLSGHSHDGFAFCTECPVGVVGSARDQGAVPTMTCRAPESGGLGYTRSGSGGEVRGFSS
ncbi:hypothetical protein SAVCW2_74330 [Streptomyces avermitilis]|nr:hypothetical protein SAVCW2_74330 [Streptomyces avermitilis]